MEARQNPVQKQSSETYGLESIWQDVHHLPRLSRAGVLMHHLKIAFSSLLASPLTFFVTTLTVSLTLFLLATLILLRSNVEVFFGESGKNIPMRIFLKDSIPEEASKSLLRELKAYPGVSSVMMTSKEEALKEFQEQLGEHSAVLDGLQERNPLPASYTLLTDAKSDAASIYEALYRKYQANEHIDFIEYRQGMMIKLQKVLTLVQRFGMLALIFMVLLAAGIIAGAIRLAVYARRAEISIMQLVGATESYVRMPFLIEGFFQGLLGAVIALILLYGLFAAATGFLVRSELSELLQFQPVFLGFVGLVVVLFTGVVTGLLGSFLAVRHFEEHL